MVPDAEHVEPPTNRRAGRSPTFWLRALGIVFFVTATASTICLLVIRNRQLSPSTGAPPDPRLAYDGPFRNVHPGVRYAAESSCGSCHEKEARAFAQHPMGRSLQPIAAVLTPAGSNPANSQFSYLGSTFDVARDGEHLQHRRRLFDPLGAVAVEQTWEVQYAIGSGNRGFSYFSQKDGFLFQTPVSWFSQKKCWDLSPAFAKHHLAGRPVLPGCLYCHANRANHEEHTSHRYAAEAFSGHAIGCQRCHGPGALHVAAAGQLQNGIDPTIVNPKHLAARERESVCEQCHLHGQVRVLRHGRELYDFRPGLPLDQFLTVFVPAVATEEVSKAVGQVEQMYESRCFQKSTGAEKMGCISCHDPHVQVPESQQISYYRERCLRCHERQGCSVPAVTRQAAGNHCVACHMPQYGTADIPHAASTDHRILRKGKPLPTGKNRPLAPDSLPLVAFHSASLANPHEYERDLAIAIVELATVGGLSAGRAVRKVLPSLEEALQRDRNDLKAAEVKAEALGQLGRWADALEAYEAILARTPDHESALAGAALMAEPLGMREVATAYWRRAAARNPRSPTYRHSLAVLLIKAESWLEALQHCSDWIKLDPFSASARASRITCLLAVGNVPEARAEFARIEVLAPENLAELRERFASKLR